MLKTQIETDLDRFKTQLAGTQVALQKRLKQADLPAAQQQVEGLLHLLVASDPAFTQIVVLTGADGVLAGTGSEQANRHFADELQTLPGLVVDTHVDASSAGDSVQTSLSAPVFPDIVVREPERGFVLALGIDSPVATVLAARLDATGRWLGDDSLMAQIDGHGGYYYLLDGDARLMAGLAGDEYRVGDVVEHLTTSPALLATKQWPLQQAYRNGAGSRVYASRTEIPALGWTCLRFLALSVGPGARLRFIPNRVTAVSSRFTSHTFRHAW